MGLMSFEEVTQCNDHDQKLYLVPIKIGLPILNIRNCDYQTQRYNTT